MPNFQSFDSSSNAALAQLVEVDAQLAAHEADLMAQLQSIQEKRKSLKTVIDMFAATDTAKPVEAPTPAITNGKLESSANVPQPAPNKSVDTNSETQSLDDSQLSPTPTADANGNHELSDGEQESIELDGFQAAPDLAAMPAATQSNRKQKKTATSTNRRRTAKTARETNPSKKPQGWQDYLREEFSAVALPDAVSAVLQQQQEQALEIAAIVDAIFAQEMPSSVRNKARDRVSNILSEGVRKNKWYRADAGSYSVSASTT